MARRTLAGVAAFSVLANLLMLAMPIYFFRMADSTLPGGSIDPLLILPGLTLVLLATMSMLDLLRRRHLARLGDAMETVLGSAILSELLMSTPRHDGGQMQVLRVLHKVRGFLSSPTMLVLFDAPLTPILFAIVFLINPALGAIALFAGLAVSSAALFKNTGALRLVRIAAPAAFVGWGVHLVLAGPLTVGMMIAASIVAGRALQTLAVAIEGWEYGVQTWAEYVGVCASLERGQLSNAGGILHPAPVPIALSTNILPFRNSAAKRRHIAMSC